MSKTTATRKVAAGITGVEFANERGSEAERKEVVLVGPSFPLWPQRQNDISNEKPPPKNTIELIFAPAAACIEIIRETGDDLGDSLSNAGYNRDEPRIPAGQPGGGHWTSTDGDSFPASVTLGTPVRRATLPLTSDAKQPFTLGDVGPNAKPDRLSDKANQLIIKYEVDGRANYNRHPEWPKNASGVTIGIGYDLGTTNLKTFKRDWGDKLSADDFKALSAAIGLRGAAAEALAAKLKHIKIPWAAAWDVYQKRSIPESIALTLKTYPGSENLPPDSFGALVSMTFNRGEAMHTHSKSKNPEKWDKDDDRYAEKRKIREAIKNGQPELVPDLIRRSIRIWRGTPDQDGLTSRRKAEADLFESGLSSH